MQIRPGTIQDLENLREIDGTVESGQYLHLEQLGEGLTRGWQLEQRPLRSKLIEPNRLADDTYFLAKQILSGIDEGVVLVAQHDDLLAAAAVAQPRPELNTLHLVDLRVDYDFRRQGLGMAIIYELVNQARDAELRAVSAETLTNNLPASGLLIKCGFELSGVDVRRRTNHDMVKETATLFWYAALD
jgi:ribosomal protein S18 acetylase RimI-like enzyme